MRAEVKLSEVRWSNQEREGGQVRSLTYLDRQEEGELVNHLHIDDGGVEHVGEA